MFKKLKLRNQMLLGYSVPMLLLFGLAVPIFTSANKVAEAFKKTNISTNVIEKTDQMGFYFGKMIGDIRGHLIIQDEAFLKDYEEDSKKFMEIAQNTATIIENAEQKQRLKEMVELKQRHDVFVKKISFFLKQKNKPQAIKLFSSKEGEDLVNNFDDLNQKFNDKEHEILSSATVKAEENINFLSQFVVFSVVLGIAFALIAAFFISSGIANRIYEAIAAIASSATEIAATVDQQERTAAQQASAVNQTTTTMDELNASSQGSSQQAEVAAAGAHLILTLVNGRYDQHSIVMEEKTLKQKILTIATEISRLSEQTHQIGKISNIVSELANQTNMLALNAAVEAVRAGEYGKGFAVVASEIRKLADRSKESAERINSIVFDIQTATNSTVMATQEGQATLEKIVSAIDDVVLSSQQISLNAKQQAVAVQQVVEAMNSLKQGASQTASGISQTKVSTQKLNEAAMNLKSVV
ncbi:methyl-accepting chemotaxis protein [Argonema galeatum]|uniref:methyl-accepting chemotaxis protein n=1 Tax=Argonema galeatum TaxID=2942762 RepID=UPI00201281D3|nr:methyl-accepting chemotaxis protein [Argonema galeatum]MCL1468308.1 methyl-accepting chemotaxis protein [Argonema galeatum A003/A1]